MSDSRLPDWLSAHSNPKREPPSRLTPRGASSEGKALLFAQFEMVLPRILEQVCEGYTLANAIEELPIPMDAGAFMRWLKKQPQLYEMYKEAKEIRTETWAGRIIDHAEGQKDGFINDVARSKVIVDVYWKLMAADNRKQYGDTKTIEMNTSISITAALAQAQGRVIDAAMVEDDDSFELITGNEYKQLPTPVDEYGDDE